MYQDKRGILLKETIYLLLSIILISMIFPLVANGINLVSSNKEKVQATGTLDQLALFLDGLQEGQTDKFIIYNPKDYYLLDSRYVSNLPLSAGCTGANCICICEEEDCSGEKVYCKDVKKPWTTLQVTSNGPLVMYDSSGRGFDIKANPAGFYSKNERSLQIKIAELTIRNDVAKYTILNVGDFSTEEVTLTSAKVKPGVSVKTPGFVPAPARHPDSVVDRIVLHHTAGTSWSGAYSEFQSRSSEVSSHYIVDKNGLVYYIVDESLKALHAGNEGGINDRSIGIEIVNTGSEPFTEAQYVSLNKLLREIDGRYPDIVYDDGHIIGHYQTPQGIDDNKQDPSSYFAWAEIGLPNHPLKQG